MAQIVVAEDDVHLLRVVCLWLRRSHHIVHEARNGREALEAVRRHRPDVLVCDVNMPVMDGLALVASCAAEGLPRMGTLVLTSRCDQSQILDRLAEYGGALHPKPFSPSKLTAEVESILSGRARTAHTVDRAAGGDR